MTSLLPALPACITTILPSTDWTLILNVRDAIRLAVPSFLRKQSAFLFPDGDQIHRRFLWVRVPIMRGFRRAARASQMDTDRFPRNLVHAFTFVVASQRDTGPHVYPVNTLINRMIPDLDRLWRGNVLVFKHSTTNAQNIINIAEMDLALVEIILTRVLRDKMVGC
ncbi:hypothetical protein C8J57DRAFT_1538572 [Mycena rebaudengoi]|nr:hypothetical protein C8J57DRAFT_1538572 [Mycena rebaudengoi]